MPLKLNILTPLVRDFLLRGICCHGYGNDSLLVLLVAGLPLDSLHPGEINFGLSVSYIEKASTPVGPVSVQLLCSYNHNMQSERRVCVHIVALLHAQSAYFLVIAILDFSPSCMPWPFRTSGLVIWMFLFRFVLQRWSLCGINCLMAQLRPCYAPGCERIVCLRCFYLRQKPQLLFPRPPLDRYSTRAMWNDFISSTPCFQAHPALGRCVARNTNTTHRSDTVSILMRCLAARARLQYY